MGILKKIIRKDFFKSVGSGIVDTVPVISTIKNNIESDQGGKGNLDYIRIATAVIILVVFYLVVSGSIDLTEAKEILDLFVN